MFVCISVLGDLRWSTDLQVSATRPDSGNWHHLLYTAA